MRLVYSLQRHPAKERLITVLETRQVEFGGEAAAHRLARSLGPPLDSVLVVLYLGTYIPKINCPDKV